MLHGGTCNSEWMKSHLFVTWEIIQDYKILFEILNKPFLSIKTFLSSKVYAV